MKQICIAHDFCEIPLKADYSMSVYEVFQQATAWVIDSSGWLGILALLYRRRRLDSMPPHWPSWVPDLRDPFPRPMCIFAPDIVDRVARHASVMTPETQPVVQGPEVYVSIKRIGVIVDVGDTYEAMLEEGCFEMSARLLLRCPEVVNGNGHTRLDLWMDALSGISTETPCEERRAEFKHWLSYFMYHKMQSDFREGKIERGREYLETMPSLMALADSDETNVIPSLEYWMSIGQNLNRVREIMGHRPSFATIEIDGRRLFRLSDFALPTCPSATLLGIGPEDVQAGDEVCLVAGTVMPVVLRRGRDYTSGHTLPTAQAVGEARLSWLDEIVPRLEDEEWLRWVLR